MIIIIIIIIIIIFLRITEIIYPCKSIRKFNFLEFVILQSPLTYVNSKNLQAGQNNFQARLKSPMPRYDVVKNNLRLTGYVVS